MRLDSQVIIYSPDVNLTEKKSGVNNNIQEIVTVSDILSATNIFKSGSVGEKVSFKKESGSNPLSNKDVIIPGELEITRSNNGGGIYNIALESSFNSNQSPLNTAWNTQYVNPENTSWSSLWDISNRQYETWRNASQTPEGNYAPPQYVGIPSIMRYDNGLGNYRYWLVVFTEWGVGSYGEYGFAYDRYEIFPSVEYTKENYDDAAVDIVSEGVHIKRDNQRPLYNSVNEPYSEVGVSPRNTKWNSVYTDSRVGYSGYSDLSNIESRVYTDFALALDYAVGSNVLDTDLIMHDLTTDLYYKVNFNSWTSGANGGGFSYTRTIIPQLNNPDVSSTSSSSNDGNGNFIIADSSNLTVSVGNGESHLIDNFSGMLLVNDHYNGSVEMWLCGGGPTAVLVNSTPYGPGTGDVTMDGNGYSWTNTNNQQGPFTFTVIKTRQGS